jgi:ribokinase
MSTSSPRICVVGSANIDLTFRAPRFPRPGETLTGQSFQLGFGGKGANQAVMAARLGAAVTMVGKVGRDVFGEGARRALQEQGIDTTYLWADETRTTGAAAIFVDSAARNSIVVAPGANLGLSPPDVQAAAAAIQHADLVLSQLEVPAETALEAFRLAKAAGVRTILNPAPAAPATQLPTELLGQCDWCVPNEPELEQLTGMPIVSLPEIEAAAHALTYLGTRSVIVTLGERGVLLLEAGAARHVPAFAVKAFDTTGAGDAFIGGLAVFLAEGRTMLDALKRANAAAALSVTRPGTQASFPSLKDLEAFLAGPAPNSYQ